MAFFNVTIIFVFISLFLFECGFFDPFCCEKFNRKRWIEAQKGSDWQITERHMKCIRGKMVSDIKTNVIEIRMNKIELFRRLGKPDHRNKALKNCYLYYLGYCQSWNDFSNFQVCFDDDDQYIGRLP